jgi:hypothetical protein
LCFLATASTARGGFTAATAEKNEKNDENYKAAVVVHFYFPPFHFTSYYVHHLKIATKN